MIREIASLIISVNERGPTKFEKWTINFSFKGQMDSPAYFESLQVQVLNL